MQVFFRLGCSLHLISVKGTFYRLYSTWSIHLSWFILLSLWKHLYTALILPQRGHLSRALTNWLPTGIIVLQHFWSLSHTRTKSKDISGASVLYILFRISESLRRQHILWRQNASSPVTVVPLSLLRLDQPVWLLVFLYLWLLFSDLTVFPDLCN